MGTVTLWIVTPHTMVPQQMRTQQTKQQNNNKKSPSMLCFIMGDKSSPASDHLTNPSQVAVSPGCVFQCGFVSDLMEERESAFII